MSATGTPVQITLSDEDFEFLTGAAMQWAGNGWEGQVSTGRFLTGEGLGDHPATHWKMAYWAPDRAHAVLAVAFLTARGFGFQVAPDGAATDAGACGEWVILTDYVTPAAQVDYCSGEAQA